MDGLVWYSSRIPFPLSLVLSLSLSVSLFFSLGSGSFVLLWLLSGFPFGDTPFRSFQDIVYGMVLVVDTGLASTFSSFFPLVSPYVVIVVIVAAAGNGNLVLFLLGWQGGRC